MINVGDLLAVLKLRDEMSPALNGAGSALGRFSSLAETSTYQVTLLGRGIRQLGGFLTGAVTLPLLGAASAAIKFGGDFEEVTTRLSTLANVSENDLEMVKKKILEMAPAVGIGPVALAEAMYTVSSRIDDTKVSLEILNMAAKASAVGMGDVKTVAGAITTIINSYGKENISAAKATDIMAQSIKRGGAEAKDLAPTLANVVPFAAKLGVSFEEVAANLATITSVGVPTSEAVTQLTSVFAGMTRETNAGKAALEGVAITGKSTSLTYAQLRAEIKEKGLMQTMIDLSERFKDNEAGLFKLFGRLEAYKNITSATGASVKDYIKNLEEMKSAQGSLDTMYDKASKTFNHMWQQVVVELEVVATELGTALLPIVKDFLQIVKDDFVPVLKDLVQGFKDMPPWMQKATVGFLGFVALIGPALFTIGQLVMAIGNIGRAIGYLTLGQAAEGLSAMKWLASAGWSGLAIALGEVALAIGAIWAAWKIGNTETMKNAISSWIRASPDPISVFARWAAGIEEVGWKEAWESTQATAAAVARGTHTKAVMAGIAPMASHTKFTEESIKMMASHGAAMQTAGTAAMTLQEKVKALTQEQRNQIIADKAYGMNIKQIAADTKIGADVIGVFLRQMGMSTSAANKAAADMKPFNDAMEELNSVGKDYTETIAEMDGGIAAAVTWYLKAGVSQGSLATAYELTSSQVRALAKAVEEEAKIQREADAAAKAYGEAWDELNAIGVNLQGTLEGLSEETIAYIKAKLEGGARTEILARAMNLEVVQIKAVDEILKQETKTRKEAEDAAERYNKALEEFNSIGGSYKETMKSMNKETIDQVKYLLDAKMSHENIRILLHLTEAQIDAIVQSMKGYRSEIQQLTSALGDLSSVSSGVFGEQVDWLGKLVTSFGKVLDSMDLFKKGFANLTAEGGDRTRGLLQVSSAAIQMSASFMQAVKSGTALQATMSGAALGATIGGAVGSAFPIIGTGAGALAGGAIGAAGGWLAHLFGKKSPGQIADQNATNNIKSLQEELIRLYGSISNIEQIGGAAGAELAAAWGSQGQAGLAHFQALVEKFNASVTASNASLARQKEILDKIATASSRLTELQGKLASDGLPFWQDMKDAAEKYGISLDGLGSRYDQLAANANTQDIINAFDTLTKGGASVGHVLNGMADEISKVVQNSMQFGTTIPSNMQPWIKYLMDTGQLLDASGNKITDISNLKFGDEQKSEFEKVTAEIAILKQELDDLEAELENELAASAARAAGSINDALDTVDWDTFMHRGIEAMQAIEEAATGAAWGHSPTGIKEIGVVSGQAGESLKQLGKIAYETFSTLEETSTYWAHTAVASFDDLGSMLQDAARSLEDLVATPLQRELNSIDRDLQSKLQEASKFSNDPRYQDLIDLLKQNADIKGSQAVLEARKKEIEDAKKDDKKNEDKIKTMKQIQLILAQIERNKPKEQINSFSPTFLNIPSFDGGGFMPNDGLAYLHAGEQVYTKKQQAESGDYDVIIPVNVDGVQIAKVIHRVVRRHRVR